MAATVLVCRCGKRISAPGATPGRVGRCPACGAMLRVPRGRSGAGESDSHHTPATPPGDPFVYHVMEPPVTRASTR